MASESSPGRLLVLDVDGTLLRRDGRVHARDAAAIADASKSGTRVTLATGRLVSGTLGLARSLGIEAPFACADGAVIACPKTGTLLATTSLPRGVLDAFVMLGAEQSLARFVAFPSALVGLDGLNEGRFLAGWSKDVEASSSVESAIRAHGAPVIAFALGARDRVIEAHARARRAFGGAAELASFGLGEGAPWALRAAPKGAEKGVAIRWIAAHLGVDRASVAAVGDWYNDVSMLAWVGHSFAMGHSPRAVRAAAHVVLEATEESGNPVVEVLRAFGDHA